MVEGNIESIAFGGEGIMRQDGLVIFVPFTAPGDRIAIEITTRKKRFAKAHLLEILTPSANRVSPSCSYYGKCGGCQIQHLSYLAQLNAKKQFIIDALERIGKISPPPFSVAPATEQWHYRRHIRLQLIPANAGFKAGYTEVDHGKLLPVEECPIFLTPSSKLLKKLQKQLQDLLNDGVEKGSVRIIKRSDEKYLLAFDFLPKLPTNSGSFAKEQLENPDISGVIFRSGNQTEQWGNTECKIEILGIQAEFSPYGFVQNHPEQNVKLYQAILEAVPSETRKILDLYCGVGITSTLFAQKGIEVIGIESHAETIALAQKNCGDRVRFAVGKVEEEGLELIRSENADLILCNPPRIGIDPDVLRTLLAHPPKTLLYVSCMPSTLARDLQILLEGNYRLEKLEAFDMFPQTTHVETLAVLSLIS